jgi:hypothetical protein
MKMSTLKKTATLLFLVLIPISYTYSQNYYITTGNDSVVCKKINFFDTNAQGEMIDLEYITKMNDTIRLKKRNVPEIKTICQNGIIYLRMPLNINKPDGYYRYGRRMVKGKIIVDVFDDVNISYRLKENFDGSYSQQGVMKETREGIYLRHVRMPDGTVYEVSGLKALKALKAIRKFMFECEQYKKEYYSNPKYQTCTFEEAVADYNKMCP